MKIRRRSRRDRTCAARPCLTFEQLFTTRPAGDATGLASAVVDGMASQRALQALISCEREKGGLGISEEGDDIRVMMSKSSLTPLAQAAGMDTSLRSRSAANASHARMSSRFRSGKSARISPSDMPDARNSSTSYTVRRRPRMHGFPPRFPGSSVITCRSSTPSGDGQGSARSSDRSVPTSALTSLARIRAGGGTTLLMSKSRDPRPPCRVRQRAGGGPGQGRPREIARPPLFKRGPRPIRRPSTTSPAP